MNNLTATKYQEMLIYAAHVIDAKKEEINDLNVFPVPDGDTGSNMNMSYKSGVDKIKNKEYTSISTLASEFSKGLLIGARGNSGVILSQFFRGIAEGLEGIDEATTQDFHKAISNGKTRAYASVIKPVEGTILTVIKDISSNIRDVDEEFNFYFESILEVGNISLDNTPNLLPILKEVGVVDSGGKGLITIFEGMNANLKGETIDLSESISFEEFTEHEKHDINIEDIVYGYCTEMLIRLSKDIDEKKIIKKLEKMGDSLVCIKDDDILKVHVHTEKPLEVFAIGEKLGSFIHLKVDNMREQALEQSSNEQVEQGLVAVASSEELGSLFTSIQKVELVSGGQTLNPSTEDIVNAIIRTNAKKVIVLPNNSNIIMAAKAANNLLDNVEVKVLETKFMTQGIEALINYSQQNSFEDNYQAMLSTISELDNYEITSAIKSTSIDGVKIKKNDSMVINNGKIINSLKNEEKALYFVIDKLIEDDVDLITLLTGKDANSKLVTNIKQYIETESPFTEIQHHDTKQDIYPYLVSGL
ncbi:MAG: DAK2 domain-containing protein [Mycoplasmatales bacterium]